MTINLQLSIELLPDLIGDGHEEIHMPDRFLTPGFWIPFTAACAKQNVDFHQIKFANAKQQGYAQAVKLDDILDPRGGTYPYERKNCGSNYSVITPLVDAVVTDQANSMINGCLRSLCPEGGVNLTQLCGVVGELHDNVWSHGKDTGYSMAQKFPVLGESDSYIEFCLADKGLGFMREMRGAKRCVESHREAIEWCIQEGNSTKLPPDDQYAQRLPDDFVGESVYGSDIAVYSCSDGNHHQGLGLSKLVALVRKTRACLQIVSGDCIYKIGTDGIESFHQITDWDGVAISCRFRVSRLSLIDEFSEIEDNVDSLELGRLFEK